MIQVNNESCMFGGANPVLNWTLIDTNAMPTRAFLQAIVELRKLGAEVSKVQHVRQPAVDIPGMPHIDASQHWCASIRIRRAPGTPQAIAVGGLLRRLDDGAYNGAKLGSK